MIMIVSVICFICAGYSANYLMNAIRYVNKPEIVTWLAVSTISTILGLIMDSLR
jgi:hypothetical protein